MNIVAQLVAPAIVVFEGWEAAGMSLDQIDPATVMTTEDCVDASLPGLANGETITIPTAEDAGFITTLTHASNALFAVCMTASLPRVTA